MKGNGRLVVFTTFVLVVTARSTESSTLPNFDQDIIPYNECDLPDCEILPPAPPEEDQPSLELFDLLSRGSEFLANYTDVNEAVVLLGNTGAGKTTLTQILAGNLSKLHSVLTSGCNPVIIDEDNKIGVPSTKSKTLFPELFFRPGPHPNTSSLPVYDYPGFDDTRGDVEDIAANFFMNQVTGKVTSLKMLFLVIHSSVKFEERKDFDLLATHAATFVKNLEKFTESFALIVTKVTNFNSMGGYVQDRTIVAGIVEFLTKYREDLQSKLETKTAVDEELTKRKLVFVDTILEQHPVTGNYSKIWFVRSPIECGPLSDQEMIHHTKNNISGIIDMLEYTRVNTEVDFGFTLKSETKLILVNYTRSINSVITSSVKSVTQMLQDSFFIFEKLVDANNLNFTQINSTMYEKRSSLELVMELNDTSLTNSVELANSINLLWANLNHNLPDHFLNFMRWQEEYLSFFDKATEEKQDRDIVNWIEPLKAFASVFFNHLDWYEFCLFLDSTVTTYEFQSTKSQLPVKSANENWIDYIDQYVFSVSRQIKDIAETITAKHLELLDFVMTFALHENEVICDSTLHAAIVHGHFLQLNRHVDTTKEKCGRISQIHLYAAHTIFLDADVTLKDLDIIMIAPIWQSPILSEASLILEGQTPSGEIPAAASGTDCYGGGDGMAGNAGITGKPGAPGGLMLAVVDHFDFKNSQNTFSVSSIGGDGGKGQDGGEGGIGCKHADEEYKKDGDNYDSKDSWYRYCYPIFLPIWRVIHYGHSGYNGGKGGNGGIGGQGGFPGFIEVFQLDGSEVILSRQQNGSVGQSGLGGIGGNGGATGKGYNCENSCYEKTKCQDPAPDAFPSRGRVPGVKGSDGNTGTSDLGAETPVLPRSMIERWIPIIKFKALYFNSTNPTTSSFLRIIDGNQAIQTHFSLKALAEESLALAKVNRANSNLIRLREMYTSLKVRLEDFAEANYSKLSDEHKKIVYMLLTSACSALMSLDQYQNFDVIVDVSYYFTIVNMQIDSLRTSTSIVAIQQAKQQFQGNLKEKVDQALGFLEDIVTPAIYEAAKDIEEQLGILEEQLVNLILDTKLSLEDCKEKLRKANDQQGFFKFLKVFNVITSIGTAFMPTPEFKTFDILVKQLQAQFSGSSSDLERLKQLVEEAEKLVADLEKKREAFQNNFQPLVDSLLKYFRNVSESLAAGTEVAKPQLGMTKWETLGKLKETKYALETFSDSSLNVRPLSNAFDQIYDAMTMAIDLYEMIDEYMETQSLASFIAIVTSASLDPVPITDPQLAHTVANFDMKLKENLLDVEVNKAMHAFKQWVFPFAKLYFGGQIIQDHSQDDAADLGAEHIRKVENLHIQLEKYKAMSIGGQDTFIVLTNFSSGLKTGKPFFTWENTLWRTSIEDLTSGSTVLFNADVKQQGLDGWESVKFRLIEINFKLNNAPEGMQEDFDDIIEYFGISMTHSGVSYYRFQQDYFVITGANQTLSYNFERDSNGNRLGTNQVYEKFKNDDYLLSPYTMWKIQLLNVVPIRKGNTLRKDVDFDSLKQFVQFMDVELVGMGVYVKGREALEAAGGDLQLDMFYEKDERIRIE